MMCTAEAGFAQTFHYGAGFTDRYHPYCLYDHDGFPCEHRYTVSLLDQIAPAEKPVKLDPAKKIPTDDPLRARQKKRMTVIDSTNFVNTNTVQIEIAPGLTPKN